MSRARRTRPDLDAVRREVLEAGRHLLSTRSGPVTFPVKLTDACRQAGHPVRLAASLWPDRQGFQADLATYLASSFEWAGPDPVQAKMVEIVTTCEDFDEAIRRAGPLYLSYLLANEYFYLALQLWSTPEPGEELTAALARGYDVVHESFKNMFGGVMLFYGRQMRAPYTLDQMTATLTAVTEGLALRHRIQPEVVDAELATPRGHGSCLFAEAVLAIANRYTEDAPDRVGSPGGGRPA